MKLKITDIRIPVSLLLLGILGALIATFAPNDTIATVGGITLISASILLVLAYFPILTIKLFGTKIENKDKVVNNVGLFSLSFS
ncbi:MAG: hypothetical protein IPG89_07775 [Bacteroidetes bacterium]|nr:hypothetical protein [Bacteroidota bacterium]